ncbi:MAG: TetR/AcrR family transcriptional regulator [Sandaracinaceae bacterium]
MTDARGNKGSEFDEGDARTRVIGAATELLDEMPLSKLSMRRVAERAGVSLGTVTYHYRSRHALLEDCLEPFNDLLIRALERSRTALSRGTPFAGHCVDLVRELYPELLAIRTLVRLRLIRTLEDDTHPHHHDRVLRHPFLQLGGRSVDGWLAPRSRMVLAALAAVVARFVSFPAHELLELTGRDTLAQAEEDVQETLVFMTQRLLQPERTPSEAPR